MSLSPTVLLDGLVFPESPRWHGGRLWLSDMHTHRVLTVDLRGRATTVAHLDDKPSGIGFLPDSTPIVVSMRKRQIVRLDGHVPSVHADLNAIPGHDLNDMVVDGGGRAYVGSRFPRNQDNSDHNSGDGIVLVAPDGADRLVAGNLFSPNGSVVTPDGSTLIVSQSRSHRLVAFDIGDDGSLANRRLFASLAPAGRDPVLGRDPSADGICLDAEGGIWCGSPLTGEFLRILEGGEITHRIALAAGKWAIACALGGDDRRTLFLVTAVTTLENMAACVDYESDQKSTSNGWVEVVRVDAPGCGWP